jgi:hypothetical protein
MNKPTRTATLQLLRLQKMFGRALQVQGAQITLVETALWVLL